jgi:hypothetical protein
MARGVWVFVHTKMKSEKNKLNLSSTIFYH